ncbi:MAG: acyl-ACP--UDP-N-acetylglucosamine O-acyltransferase [Verrucomicrobiales bacterium]
MAETKIHPTAIVDPSTELGEGVEIGPYCVIHAGVRIGDGCWLQNHVTVAGPTSVGRGNRFFAYASIGQQTQDLKYQGEPTYLEIGEQNTFREFVTVNRGSLPETKTVVGSHGNFLAYSHIAHDCVVGDHVIFSNNGTLGGHVEVGDYAILGGLSAVHQFCRVGTLAITGGCTKIVQDIPPFMIADGNPAEIRAINAVGLKRRGVSAETLRKLKEAHRILYRKGYNSSQALEELAALSESCEEVALLRQFVQESERGIIR